jgi:hypothetical protein
MTECEHPRVGGDDFVAACAHVATTLCERCRTKRCYLHLTAARVCVDRALCDRIAQSAGYVSAGDAYKVPAPYDRGGVV